MLMAAYSALLGLGLAVSAPWWLLRMATTARYREGLGERLGLVPARLREATRHRRVIWVHAVSVGEVLAVSRLANELEAALNGELEGLGALRNPRTASLHPDGSVPSWRIVLSTTTRTGQALARQRFGAAQVFYLPLDFGWAVRAYLRALRPALLLLAESELWPRLLHECRCRSIPVAVVNARVSDRSFRRARLVRPLWRPVLRQVTKFLAQSDTDAERLRSLGARPEAVAALGNLKYDARAPGPSRLAEALRAVCAGHPVVIAGSTVEGEEDLVLSAFREVRKAVPGVVLLLAPRHPERFKAVLGLATDQATDSDVMRASSLLELAGADAPLTASVIVLDTVGDLAAAYSLADVVFVGGSLVPRGGHNPLEPARFGIPVVIGPSFENFRDVVAAMSAGGGLRIVKDEAELSSTLTALLANPEMGRDLGKRGQKVFEREGGATARSIQSLMPLLASSDPLRPRNRRDDVHAPIASREVPA